MEKQKPTLQYVILCDDVAVYQDSNKVAVLGVFEQIFVEQLPTSHPKFWLMTRFTNGLGSYKTQNKIINPLGDPVFESEEVSFTLDSTVSGYNINGQLVGLPLENEGIYWVETYLDGNIVNSTPLHVITKPPEPTDQKEITYH